jgi:phosphate:Na+ symporter
MLGIILGIIGSIALFLYSVVSFGRMIKRSAGDKAKKFLSSMASNPLKGVLFGAVSTAILQSSSATSVSVASLADAGLISFYSTLGIIFGVNIGTTITSQLVAFNVMAASPFIILLGVIVKLWGNSFKKYGKPIIYFGLLYFSIYLISVFVSYIDQQLLGSYLSVTSNLFVAILVGLISSILFQSSSVVSGIVLVLVGGGYIGLNQAIGFILGANIGTTSTVIIASLTMGKIGKRVAMSHFLFNLLGVLAFIPFIGYFLKIVQWLDGDAVHQVANIYLIFNLICTIIFLFAIKPFHRLVNKIIK